MVELREITRENYEECLALKVAEDQKNFVSPTMYSLAEAWVFYRTAYPFAVYAEGRMVGFLMLGYYEERNQYTLWRFLIDQRYQKRGYGRKALELGMKYLVDRFGVKEVYTAYVKGNRVARDLYASFGFRETGESDEKQVEMKWVVDGGAPTA